VDEAGPVAVTAGGKFVSATSWTAEAADPVAWASGCDFTTWIAVAVACANVESACGRTSGSVSGEA